MNKVDRDLTALVITDPQNDFLSPEGVTWGVVGESVTENHTVEHLEALLKAAKENGIPVFISPHYYYPTDHRWKFEGALEKMMHDINMFERKGALSLDGFENSGADWLARYKPYIEDGETVVVSPHKVLVQRQTTSCSSCASVASTTSFLPGCQRICASNRTCVSCWSRAST